MKTKTFRGVTITDELPKVGDTVVCINRKSMNYGDTEKLDTLDRFDYINWKLVVSEKKVTSKKVKGIAYTYAEPKVGDTLVCVNRKSVNYGKTEPVEKAWMIPFLDMVGWKVVTPEAKIEGLEKYPEFKELVNQLAVEVCEKINAQATKIKSKMPYKAQFTLEELIKELQSRV